MNAEELPDVPLGKIVVLIDLPEEIKKEHGITDEEINKIVNDSIFMIVGKIDDLIGSKKKGKVKDDGESIYS